MLPTFALTQVSSNAVIVRTSLIVRDDGDSRQEQFAWVAVRAGWDQDRIRKRSESGEVNPGPLDVHLNCEDS